MPTNRQYELKMNNATPYYELAFGSLMRTQWDGIHNVANDETQIADLAFYRALTCWYERDRYAIQDRRDLLFQYARGEFKTDNADDTLNRYYQRLPVRSRVRRVLRQLCTLYNEDPNRSFGEDKPQEIMSELYANANVTSDFRDAHEMAKLTGMVGVRPMFDEDGNLEFDKLTLDKCRLEMDGRRVVGITYPRVTSTGAVEYVSWTDEDFVVRNYKGEVDTVEPNRYGRIPFVWLRFGGGKFGEPLFELCESQTDANKTRLLARVNLTYTGLAVWLGINLGEEDVVISPDHLLAFEDVREGEGLEMPPHLESISPDAQFEEIDAFADNTERALQHEQGIPPSMTSNEQQAPPSGIARVIERSELIEARMFDRTVMQKFEAEMARMIALVGFRDGHLKMDYSNFIDLNVTYSEEQLFIEPTDEFEFDKARKDEELFSLRAYFEKWGTGYTSDMTDDEFIERLQENAALNERIRAVIGKGTSFDDASEENAQQSQQNSASDDEIIVPDDDDDENDNANDATIGRGASELAPDDV